MGDPAKSLITEEKPKDSLDIIKSTHTSEIVIALCGQLGTDLKKIEELLTTELKHKFRYECQTIKLSSFISRYTDKKLSSIINSYERIKAGMDGGNELREKYDNQILAEFAIQKIISDRVSEESTENLEQEKFDDRRKCFIIDSIKHPAEIKLLNEVYRDSFYVIGVFSPIGLRAKNLEKSFGLNSISKVYELINRDTGEDLLYGQKVEESFINSDYFIRVSSNEKRKLKPKIERFLNLLFDIGINTPSPNETPMYQATAAAANSACLSRQVGACITDSSGDILSLGWNDVPTYGGNLYPNSDLDIDERCYNIGDCECANIKKKEKIKSDILTELNNAEILKPGEHTSVINDILDRNGIKNLIEFARSIHAEMHAIILGSQKSGSKMVGGKLYCTTYPCHNCARHIIVAGISEVYYIEPYKKSLGIELHADAITEDENENNKVRILMYEGVAPKKYMEFYKLVSDDRKIKVKYQDLYTIKPKSTITLRALHQLEASVSENLKKKGL